MRVLFALCLLASLAHADTQPTPEAALALIEKWRGGLRPSTCASNKEGLRECKHEALTATMSPPLWFGVEINDRDHISDECRPWANKKKLTKIESDNAVFTACVVLKMGGYTTEPVAATTLAKFAKRVPAAGRKQLDALAATHLFVLMSHKPTDGDPDRFELLFAVTQGDDGKARIGALFMRVTKASMDGE